MKEMYFPVCIVVWERRKRIYICFVRIVFFVYIVGLVLAVTLRLVSLANCVKE